MLGEAAENTINEMVNMGFSRDQCLAAMKAAFNNPERAIEYLLNVNILHIGYTLIKSKLTLIIIASLA